MSDQPDVIVIGSGFGGAVAATRLVEAGARVTMLERGPWRDTAPVRAAGITERSPLPAGRDFLRYALRNLSFGRGRPRNCRLDPRGLYDVHYDRDLTVLASSGVGGGSHVYTAMLTRPADPGYWDGHDDRLTSTEMEEHFRWFGERVPSRPVEPGDGVPNWPPVHPADQELFEPEGVEQPAMAYRYELGAYRNNVFTGSADGSKPTLDTALLAPAIGRGLTVRALHEVTDIARTPNGYRLRVFDHQRRRYAYLEGERVVLAAGALNTLRLLMRSRALGGLPGMPALGQGIGGNGDTLALWAQNRAGVDYTAGTPIHGRIRPRGASDAIFMVRLGLSGADNMPLPKRVRPYLRGSPLLVGMGADRANGEATWDKGRLHLRYPNTDNPILGEIADAFERLTRDSGHRVWMLPRNRGFTVHLHGGASLGTDPDRSVVDWRGEAHDHPGLHVADAAALPRAVGTPPSLTIAAWAGHVGHQLAARINADGQPRRERSSRAPM